MQRSKFETTYDIITKTSVVEPHTRYHYSHMSMLISNNNKITGIFLRRHKKCNDEFLDFETSIL